jgi:arsenate reductase
VSDTFQLADAHAPLRVLVLCTRNSARSQIAEALFKTLGGDRIVAASAGSDPGPGVHPLAVASLADVGIDWHGRPSRSIDAVMHDPWDAVITVCDAARDACPYMPTAGLTAHWGMEDPAAAPGGLDAQRVAFDVTRDRLREAVQAFLSVMDRLRSGEVAVTLRDALDAGGRALDQSAPTTFTE